MENCEAEYYCFLGFEILISCHDPDIGVDPRPTTKYQASLCSYPNPISIFLMIDSCYILIRLRELKIIHRSIVFKYELFKT